MVWYFLATCDENHSNRCITTLKLVWSACETPHCQINGYSFPSYKQPYYLFLAVPIMGISAYAFPNTAASQWLEQAVSPPRDLTAFTMIFQLLSAMNTDKDVQIACYGDTGDDCRLSVVIKVNSTLEMIIGSTRWVHRTGTWFMVNFMKSDCRKFYLVQFIIHQKWRQHENFDSILFRHFL